MNGRGADPKLPEAAADRIFDSFLRGNPFPPRAGRPDLPAPQEARDAIRPA
jgi:hypothetical protein